jgi:peptide/nickel transport system ATP-binding protein
MSELRFEAVTVRYGTGRRAMSAVDAVDLVVPSGQVVGLVGESGSGKSTLARAAVGLAPLTAGRVLLDGEEVTRRDRGRDRRPLQMVFQDPYASLDPRMSIGAAVAEAIPRRAFGSARERRAEVLRLLELVGLDAGHEAVRPGRLSGGQRQRVALARALAARPDVVIADEITSALDVSIQGTVLNLVRDLQQRMRLGMLFISHNLAVVRYVSDIVAVMYLGRIVEYGPTARVLSEPQHPYTRELLAAVPRRDGPAPDRTAESIRVGSGIAAVHEHPTGAGERLGGLGELDVPAGRKSATVTPAGNLVAVQDVQDIEPPDPHHPPAGCRFHPRCPVGPAAEPGRTECLTLDPSRNAHERLHLAACHFAAPPE